MAPMSESAALQPLQMESMATVHAIQNIVNRFYSMYAPTVFIMEQSLRTKSVSSQPCELAGEMIRIGSEQSSIAYVIGNEITLNQQKRPRHFNVFFIDSYESFRQVTSYSVCTITINPILITLGYFSPG